MAYKPLQKSEPGPFFVQPPRSDISRTEAGPTWRFRKWKALALKKGDKTITALERFQAGIAIFVSLTTAFIGWKTFQLNELAGINNDHLKQIEIRLSERKFDFEQFKDIYDRVEKYLAGEQDEQRGRALVILVSAIPASNFRAELLSMLTVQAKRSSVSTAAAASYIGRTFPVAKVSARFVHKLELHPNLGNQFMTLNDLTFIDSTGKIWIVPKNFSFTGGSIPRLIWSTISPVGEAYEYFITSRTASTSSVNQMFFDALVASGVDVPQAKALFVAVQSFDQEIRDNPAVGCMDPIAANYKPSATSQTGITCTYGSK
ncbi:MAG: hypothetical protein FD135_3388 [Comamonadaceae bacterium]|nr:MAG: hypothetical protein FD135_3388 [Comamonadaceae bacterium]